MFCFVWALLKPFSFILYFFSHNFHFALKIFDTFHDLRLFTIELCYRISCADDETIDTGIAATVVFDVCLSGNANEMTLKFALPYLVTRIFVQRKTKLYLNKNCSLRFRN